ncbi:DNA helicase MCM8 [Cucumispora dikerogammari]|nr:DNA helicase MCM8 [Cucumispora dikerogammari]
MPTIESWNLYFPEDEYSPLNGLIKIIKDCKTELNKNTYNSSKTPDFENTSNKKNPQTKNKTKNMCFFNTFLYLPDLNKNPIIHFSLYALNTIISNDLLFKNLDNALNCVGVAISDILINNTYELKKISIRILTYEESFFLKHLKKELISTFEQQKLTQFSNTYAEKYKISQFSTICAEKIENLIFFKGTVVRVGSKKIKITKPVYRCFKCNKFKVSKEVAIKQMDKTIENIKSENVNQSKSSSFKIDEMCICVNKQPTWAKKDILDLNNSELRDYQEIKIQEPDSSSPNLIEVIVFDELVGSIGPGDVVSIVGSIKAETENSVMYKLIIHVNNLTIINIHKSETTEMNSINAHDYKIFDKIKNDKNIMKIFSSTLFPNIVGHENILFALVLTLFGGSRRFFGTSVSRSDIHVLLIGDPGIGKSRILLDLIDIIPKSIYVCGTMTTTAGLTVSLTHEDGDFIAEAGALILSNNGICCIDEFDKMQGASKSILEVMEEQVVSIAKGGVVCNIPTRCSIVAASNPKFGRFKEMGLSGRALLKDTLKIERNVISRFDCVFVMKDSEDNMKRNLIKKIKDDALNLSGSNRITKTDKSKNQQIRENEQLQTSNITKKTPNIMQQTSNIAKPSSNISRQEPDTTGQESDDGFGELLEGLNENDETQTILQTLRDDIIDTSIYENTALFKNVYSKEILIKYILHSRSTNPTMTEEAKKYIEEYFQRILKNSQTSKDSFYTPTLRTLETLLRLSESVAKLKLKTEVTKEECVFAINIFKTTLFGGHKKEVVVEKAVTKKKNFHEILKSYKKKEFTLNEIKAIFESEKLHEKYSFEIIINQLNEKGLLIKAARGVYKLLC